MGYDSSMMNGLSVLTQYTEYFHLNTATTGLNNAGVWIGAVLSCLFMQPVPDRFGRKNAIYASIGVSIIGIIMQTAAQNIATFVIGRIIIGLGTQLAGAAAPTLLGEILPAARRGVVLGLFFSCYYIGSLLAAGINYRIVEIETTWAWRIPSVIQVVPSLISLALLSFLPESPRWLIFKGRVEEAREILTIVHGHSDVNSDETLAAAAEISAVLKREQELYPSNPWKELLSTKANQKRMFIMASFGIMVEFFGNFVISYVPLRIHSAAGPGTDCQSAKILSR